MQSTASRLTREQWLALVSSCASSNLTIREYAALNNVGLSALAKWSTKLGIPLRKRTRQDSSANVSSKNAEIKTDNAIDIKASGSMNQGFSFVDITDYASCRKPQVSKEKPLGGLEIRLPNGVQLKVDPIPIETLWPQVVGFVRALV